MTQVFQILFSGYANIEVPFIHLLIAIPTYFFWRRVLRNRIADKIKRSVVVLISTIALTPIIYTGLFFVFMYFLLREPSSDFDKAKWLADEGERYTMADDIVESKMLLGKDTSQVWLLLGRPKHQDSSTFTWKYYAGFGGGGIGFVFHDLEVRFEKAKVVEVEHIRMNE
jgi:hypothetical protein